MPLYLVILKELLPSGTHYSCPKLYPSADICENNSTGSKAMSSGRVPELL
jgi:hypothetical protein